MLRMGGDSDVSAWYRSAGGSSARPFPRDSGWWEEAVSRENCSSSFLGVDVILTLHDRFHSFPSLQISSRLRASGWSWSQSSRKPCLQVHEPRPHAFDSHMCVDFHACDHRLKGLCVCVCVSGRLIQRRPHDACPMLCEQLLKHTKLHINSKDCRREQQTRASAVKARARCVWKRVFAGLCGDSSLSRAHGQIIWLFG